MKRGNIVVEQMFEFTHELEHYFNLLYPNY